MRGHRVSVAGALFLVAAQVVTAQTANQGSAYAALLRTPSGALPPVFTSSGVGGTLAEPRMALRYGRYEFPGTNLGVNNLGLTIDVGAMMSDRAEFTVGMSSCAGCRNTIMAGGSFYAEVMRTPPTGDPAVGLLTIGLRPDLGVAHTLASQPWFWSASLGVPVAYSAKLSDRLRWEPFIQPGAGYGIMLQPGLHNGGVRPMLGGGVGVFASSGLGAHVGAQKVFANGAVTQWGLGLTWHSPWR